MKFNKLFCKKNNQIALFHGIPGSYVPMGTLKFDCDVTSEGCSILYNLCRNLQSEVNHQSL